MGFIVMFVVFAIWWELRERRQIRERERAAADVLQAPPQAVDPEVYRAAHILELQAQLDEQRRMDARRTEDELERIRQEWLRKQ